MWICISVQFPLQRYITWPHLEKIILIYPMTSSGPLRHFHSVHNKDSAFVKLRLIQWTCVQNFKVWWRRVRKFLVNRHTDRQTDRQTHILTFIINTSKSTRVRLLITPFKPLYLEKSSFSGHVSYVNLDQRSISFPTVYNMTTFGKIYINLLYDVIGPIPSLPVST